MLFRSLGLGFSKKIEPHAAAISLYVMHYNFCRVHESLRTTPAVALGVADRVWTLGDLLDAALATQPITPTETPAKRRSGVAGMSQRVAQSARPMINSAACGFSPQTLLIPGYLPVACFAFCGLRWSSVTDSYTLLE